MAYPFSLADHWKGRNCLNLVRRLILVPVDSGFTPEDTHRVCQNCAIMSKVTRLSQCMQLICLTALRKWLMHRLFRLLPAVQKVENL